MSSSSSSRRVTAVCLVLLLATPQLSSAQLVLRLPNPFRRARMAGPFAPAVSAAAPAAPAAASEASPPAAAAPQQPADTAPAAAAAADSPTPAKPSSKCGSNWALTAIGASSGSGTTLPASTERVLICLITSGVHTQAPSIAHNRWTGCTKEDPLDPTGCTLPWSTEPTTAGFRPRGTWAAAIMAAAGAGVIPGATDIHVVPIDTPVTGAVDPNSSALSGKSRLRAYSVCEGRLRGLQASEYGSSSSSSSGSDGGGGGKAPWRMVMFVDVAAEKPANSGTGDYAVSEGDWVKVATGVGTPEALHPPDVLIIAPAGNSATMSFPAALPGVLGVGSYKCSGELLHAYTTHSSSHTNSSGGSSKPDILAPGYNIAVPGSDKAWTDSSAAAALVAGAATRLWSAHPRCSAEEIKTALRSSGGVFVTESSRSSRGSSNGSGVASKAQQQVPRLSLAAAEAILALSDCGTTQPATRR